MRPCLHPAEWCSCRRGANPHRADILQKLRQQHQWQQQLRRQMLHALLVASLQGSVVVEQFWDGDELTAVLQRLDWKSFFAQEVRLYRSA